MTNPIFNVRLTNMVDHPLSNLIPGGIDDVLMKSKMRLVDHGLTLDHLEDMIPDFSENVFTSEFFEKLGGLKIMEIFNLAEAESRGFLKVLLSIYPSIIKEDILRPEIYRFEVERGLLANLISMKDEKVQEVADTVSKVMNTVFGQRLGISKIAQVAGRKSLTVHSLINKLRQSFEIKVGSVIPDFDKRHHHLIDSIFELVMTMEVVTDVQEAIKKHLPNQDVLPLKSILRLLSIPRAFEKVNVLENLKDIKEKEMQLSDIDLVDEIFAVHKGEGTKSDVDFSPLAMIGKDIIGNVKAYGSAMSLPIFDGIALSEDLVEMQIAFITFLDDVYDGRVESLKEIALEFFTMYSDVIDLDDIESFARSYLSFPELNADDEIENTSRSRYDELRVLAPQVSELMQRLVKNYKNYVDVTGLNVDVKDYFDISKFTNAMAQGTDSGELSGQFFSLNRLIRFSQRGARPVRRYGTTFANMIRP